MAFLPERTVGMDQEIMEARAYGERLIGRELSEDEFKDALSYAIRKAELQGNGLDYVPLLLPDVIREREFEADVLPDTEWRSSSKRRKNPDGND